VDGTDTITLAADISIALRLVTLTTKYRAVIAARRVCGFDASIVRKRVTPPSRDGCAKIGRIPSVTVRSFPVRLATLALHCFAIPLYRQLVCAIENSTPIKNFVFGCSVRTFEVRPDHLSRSRRPVSIGFYRSVVVLFQSRLFFLVRPQDNDTFTRNNEPVPFDRNQTFRTQPGT